MVRSTQVEMGVRGTLPTTQAVATMTIHVSQLAYFAAHVVEVPLQAREACNLQVDARMPTMVPRTAMEMDVTGM